MRTVLPSRTPPKRKLRLSPKLCAAVNMGKRKSSQKPMGPKKVHMRFFADHVRYDIALTADRPILYQPHLRAYSATTRSQSR